MKNKILIALILMILCPFLAKSQSTNYNLPPKTFYKSATITLKDFSKYQCKDLTIQTDSVTFKNINKRLAESVALANIDYMRVKEGNQAITGCIYGALLMGVTALYSSMNYGYNSNYNNQYSGQVIAVCTLTGGLIGGLIGLAVPKYKTYYLE